MQMKRKINASLAALVLLAVCLGGCGKEITMVGLEENESMQTLQAQEEVWTEEETLLEEPLPSVECFVYVCGAVEKEGVYKLPLGSRMFEAVEKAGGFAEDACREYVNLAQELTDGMKIYIPTQEEVLQTGSTAMTSAAPETAQEVSALVNINTAGIEQLTTLPGIGVSRAESIITYRNEQGGFREIEDIMNISGIKEGAFAKIKDKICVN